MNIDLKLDKTSVIPVYYQITQYLKEKIEAGDIKPGDKIPAEREFCEALDISRMTVRQALEGLVQEGLLEKIKGKGTFVKLPKIARPLKSLSSFTVDTISGGRIPGSKVLFFDVVQVEKTVTDALGLEAGEKVIKLARLRLENEHPHAFECSYLNYEKTKDILGKDLKDSSLYATLKEVCGIHLSKARETIEAQECPKEVAKLLEIPSKTLTFHRKRITRNDQDEIIEYVVSEYRMDKFVFVVELDNN